MYECSICPKSSPAFDVTTLLGYLAVVMDLSVTLTGITLMINDSSIFSCAIHISPFLEGVNLSCLPFKYVCLICGSFQNIFWI